MPAIKGVAFRRGFFKPQMFPHLRLASQVLNSREVYGGTGIRQCAGIKDGDIEIACGKWQPYMMDEKLPWLPIATLENLNRFVFGTLDLRVSHGICGDCFVVYDKLLTEMEKE